MEHRGLGRTGLRVSQLGFGCGNVGGLMVRGTPKDREQALARALELGINYFDTAPSYGDGLSEQHLGDAVRALNASVLIGNKFSLWPEDMSDIRGAVARSLEASLRRLGRESVDLLQLHNNVRRERHGGSVGIRDVMQELVPALVALRDQGKFRFIGITALGDTEALHELIGAGVPDTAQVCYNLLNPSADYAVPSRFPAQDFGRLLDLCRAQRVGAIGFRALAGGALSGTPDRHPIAARSVQPISTGPDYLTDVRRAQPFRVLVEENHAASLVEAALRFAISSDAMSTVVVGFSSLEHLEVAAAAVARGPLPPSALERLVTVWQELASSV